MTDLEYVSREEFEREIIRLKLFIASVAMELSWAQTRTTTLSVKLAARKFDEADEQIDIITKHQETLTKMLEDILDD